MKKAVTLKEGVFPGPNDFHNIPVLIAVEECIAWAAQQGYVYADKAAAEYGRHSGREMVEDENTGYYNTRSWQFKK